MKCGWNLQCERNWPAWSCFFKTWYKYGISIFEQLCTLLELMNDYQQYTVWIWEFFSLKVFALACCVALYAVLAHHRMAFTWCY